MSEQRATPDLVAMAHKQFETANRHELDAFMALFAADAVYDASRDGVGVFEGRDAIRTLMADWWRAFDDLRMTLEEVHDLGNEVGLAVVHHEGRPGGSSAYAEARQVYVSVLGDGLIQQVVVYADLDEARADAERLARSRA